MSGDVKHFKRRFFGGFDTTDVMLYIEELAAQRNRYKMTGDRLEAELKTLNTEIRRLQEELDEADRRIMDIKVHSLEEASGSIASLKDTYTDIRTEMESTTNNICSELSRLNGTLTSLSTVLDTTSNRFNELQTLVEHEKADAIAAHSARGVH